MAVVLGVGDSFHLVPRALALCTSGLENYTVSLGIGKWITSVTMTIFYVLLYYVWRQRYRVSGQKSLTAAVYGLSGVRIALCMLPQNQWLCDKTPLSWGIYRNIPFSLLGLLVIVLSVIHTHYFLFGMVFFLLLLLLEKNFSFTNAKTMRILAVYHIGLNLTAVMFVVSGVTQVLETALSSGIDAAISGIAGIGHILLGVSMVFLLVEIRRSVSVVQN